MNNFRVGLSWRIAVGVLIALFLTALSALIVRERKGPQRDDREEARWVEVAQEAASLKIGLVGQISPIETVSLIAPFSGVITKLEVSEGQAVELGEPLVVIDSTLLDMQIRQAFADVLRARQKVTELDNWSGSPEVTRAERAVTTVKTNLAESERRLRETRMLSDQGVVAKVELEAAEQAAALQNLEMLAAETDLKSVRSRGKSDYRQQAEIELTNAMKRHELLIESRRLRALNAPHSGIVSKISSGTLSSSPIPIQIGTRVNEGQVLLELARVSQLQVIAEVSEFDVNQIFQGQKVEVEGDGFEGILISGEVASVGWQRLIGDGSYSPSTYKVLVRLNQLLEHERRQVRIGMSARVSVTVAYNEKANLIPPSAIYFDKGPNNPYVKFRAEPRGSVVLKSVKILRNFPSGVDVVGLSSGYVQEREN